MSVLKLGEGNVTLTPESEGAEPSAWLTVFFSQVVLGQHGRSWAALWRNELKCQDASSDRD